MGTPIQKESASYAVALTVIKKVTTYKEDSYDKSVTGHYSFEVPLAELNITGDDLDKLKEKLHAHINLV